MAISEKKYYWIKLKDDFFNLETIDWLSSQQNGCEYIVLYQKLLLLTANHNGELASKIGEMIIPYSYEKIARDTKFKIDTVVVALELFKKLGLVFEQKDGVLKLPYLKDVVGSSSCNRDAMRKMKYRQIQKLGQSMGHDVGQNMGHDVGQNVPQRLEIEIRDKEIRDRDKEIEIDNNIEAEAAADTIKHDFEIRELSRSNQLDVSVFTYYERNIAPLMPIIGEKLKALIDEVGEIKVKSAIQEAATHNARSYAYIEAVARGNGKPKQEEETYEEKKARIIAKYEKEEAERRKKWTEE